MEHDVEREPRLLEVAQKVLREHEVTRARHWKELREPLNDAEPDGGGCAHDSSSRLDDDREDDRAAHAAPFGKSA